MGERDCESAGYSHRNGRVYCRTFSYAEARERHAAGENVTALAAAYGVTWKAMKRALDPEWRKRFDAAGTAYTMSGTCPVCGAVGTVRRNGESARCRTCASKDATTTVRDGELRCTRCHEWKPDAAFPLNRHESTHRGRHRLCRACQATVKREWRARRRAAGKPAP